MNKLNVNEVLEHAIQEDALPYELKAEMWSDIERKVVATRMSRNYRSSRRFPNVLTGVGTVAVLACVVFGGHYIFTHKSTVATTASHGGKTAVTTTPSHSEQTTTTTQSNSNTANTSSNNNEAPSSSNTSQSTSSVTQSTSSVAQKKRF